MRLRVQRRLDVPGFTLLELLVVTTSIAILAALLLPVLARAKIQGQGVKCLGNKSELTLAWRLYSDDNQGRFVGNDDQTDQGSNGWCDGVLSWAIDNTDNTNSWMLVNSNSLLGPYAGGQTGLYKCPADFWNCSMHGRQMPRVRSVSMNGYIGQIPTDPSTGGCNQTLWNGAGAGFRAYKRESHILNPKPSDLWLFVDEHADSINDAFFMTGLKAAAGPHFINGPAAYHDGAATFSFVDGHAEVHKWQDLYYWPPVAQTNWPGGIPEPSTGPDIQWMTQHTSSHL